MPLYFIYLRYLTLLTTLHVKVFAWSPFGNQLFWFRGFFYKSSHQFQNFRPHGDQNGCNLEGYLPCPIALHYAILESVSGFSNDVFYGGGTLTYHPTPKLEGHVMQLVCLFTQNLPSMVEPTRNQSPNW